MIYLDNASTTHKKPRSVVRAVKRGLTTLSANSGRGGYDLTIRAGQEVYETRVLLHEFLNNDSPENIVFTGSCTQAINMALRGTVRPNGHILTTTFEHNSVLRTLNYLKEKYNIMYTVIEPKGLIITREEIIANLKPNTYMIAINHRSNVLGVTQDIEMIGRICKERKLLYFVDGAQSVGHTKIDVKNCNINMLSVAGHKGVFAPQGIGVLVLNNIKIKPLIFGGTGTFSESIIQPSDPPEGLESGTLSVSNIMGLKEGVKFVVRKFNKIEQKMSKLSTILYQKLKKINNVAIYSPEDNGGVVAFNIKNKTSSEVSDILSQKYNICTRSGLHCAPYVHRYLDTTRIGAVRVSLSYYNSYADITKLIKAIEEISTT